jgi:Tol biopolymer transport system component
VAAAAALVVGALGFAAAAYLWRAPAEAARTYRTFIVSPEGAAIGHSTAAAVLALSPDGRHLAYTATGSDGRRLLWIQALETGAARPISGTDNAGYMFWSPDSRFVAFTDGRFLKKVDISGGTPFTICEAPNGLDGTWNRSDDILLAVTVSGKRVIARVAASGGTPVAVTALDEAAGDNRHLAPYFLPDGRHFIYLVAGSKANGGNDPRALYVGSIDNSEAPKLLLPGGSNAKYAQGHLFFLRGTTLMAQPLDPDRLELSGTPAPVAENLDVSGSQTRAVAPFSPSDNGLIAYLTSGSTGVIGTARLLWFDRSGKEVEELDGANDYLDVDLSPDGTRAAVVLAASTQPGRNIWMYDVRRRIRTRFTLSDAQENRVPVWSPDGSAVVFAARRQAPFEIYRRLASGAGGDERLLGDASTELQPTSWSPDSRFLLFMKAPAGSAMGFTALGPHRLWVLVQGASQEPFPYLQTEFGEAWGEFSPDGRWVAYASNESGRLEVYVVSFPKPTGKWQVSSTGGSLPRWRRDGKELYFITPDNRLMAADVNADEAQVDVGTVRALFDVRPSAAGGSRYYDVSSDGQRFLVASRPRGAALPPITLVTNWQGLLNK